MIVTWRISLRIALLILVAVLVEVSFLSYVSIWGVVPDLIPVVVVLLGLLGGAVVGAVCGFAAGLLLDSLLFQTLGVSSLVLLSIGYLAGRYREGFEITNSLTPPLVAGGLALAGAAALAAIELMLGVDVPVSLLVLREIFLKGLFAFLLAMPIYPLIRRIVRPALVDDARGRRVFAQAITPGRSRVRRTTGRRPPVGGGVV